MSNTQTLAGGLVPTHLSDLPDQILLRILHLVGPKYTRLSASSTCRNFRDLSSSDILWAQFWRDRCNRPDEHRGGTLWKTEYGGTPPIEQVLQKYIEMHARVLPRATQEVQMDTGQELTIPIHCTYVFQTHFMEDDEFQLCGNEPAVWCDFEGCENARCESDDCPQAHMSYVDEDEMEEDTMKFYTCSFCKMKACEEHSKEYDWPKPCSSCQVVSCNDCISETLVSQQTVRCQYIDNFTNDQCRETLCGNCSDAVIVEKTGKFDIKINKATKSMICQAVEKVNDSIKEGNYRELLFSSKYKICSRKCGKKLFRDLAKSRKWHSRLERERLKQWDELAPANHYTSEALKENSNEELRKMAWAFGDFLLVDLDGQMRGSKLSLGVNCEGFVSGYLMFPVMEKNGKYATDQDVNQNDVSTFDFVGLGASWTDCHHYESFQPKLVEEREDCIEITGEIAPGPNYSFRGYGNIGTESTLTLEKVDQGEHVFLRCTLIVPRDCCRCRMYFTAIPEKVALPGASKVGPASLHDLDQIKMDETKAETEHKKVKAARRKRMEALIEKYPMCGLSYSEGESSNSEIDYLADEDMVGFSSGESSNSESDY